MTMVNMTQLRHTLRPLHKTDAQVAGEAAAGAIAIIHTSTHGHHARQAIMTPPFSYFAKSKCIAHPTLQNSQNTSVDENGFRSSWGTLSEETRESARLRLGHIFPHGA